MRKPNFFILGAPKCGTTSLAAWLSEHPNIYMSPQKEPNHFNTDHAAPRSRATRYESLFALANERHVAVGEASPMYLYSDMAVGNILRSTEHAMFVVCLRNPVDMAYSLHGDYLFQGAEQIADFETAWRLSDQRFQGRHVTRWCKEPKHLAYQKVCLLGAQVARLLSQVPRTSVHFTFLEDIATDPRVEYVRILSFLQVEDDGRVAFPALNPAKTSRYSPLTRGVLIANHLRRSLGIQRKLNLNILTRIDNYNRVVGGRPPLPLLLRRQLQDYFRDDVALLAAHVGRDLSTWLQS